jgi:hypothetical protein
MSVYLQPRNPVAGLSKLIFPYTPQIDYSNDVKYEAYSLTHTNYQPYGYNKTDNPNIGIQAKFSSHTTDHFALSEYAIRFLRTYTKMNYGRADPDRGQPPRILRFFAHGTYVFNNVPVIISKFSMTFPEDVDYIKGIYDRTNKLITGIQQVRRSDVPTNYGADDQREEQPPLVVNGVQEGSVLFLPSVFTINISLLVQPNIYRTVQEFTLEKFATGALASRGYV